MMLARIVAATLLLPLGAYADSLLTAQTVSSGPLVSDLKQRFEIGDIITVMVRERVDASTTAGTNTKKESDIQAQAAEAANQFLVADNPGNNILSPTELPNWDIQAENETRTTGTTRRSSQLELTITCVVTRIIDDNLIFIEGNKRVTVNREDSQMQVSGVIRARDVTASNTIASSQIANANIKLDGKGPLWNNQRRGIFTKILDWFSPF